MDASIRYGCGGSAITAGRDDRSELAVREEYYILLCYYVCVLGGIRIRAGVRIVVSSKYIRNTILLRRSSHIKELVAY